MDAEERYRETMGHEPPPPHEKDAPLAWQWDYQGSREERERLRLELDPAAEPDRGPQPDQDEALF